MGVKARCAECTAEWLIFDCAKHGYDAFVGESAVSVPESQWTDWHCPVCGGEIFRFRIAVEPADREELLADGFSEDAIDFSEMFAWITIGLECTECHHSAESWVDMETM